LPTPRPTPPARSVREIDVPARALSRFEPLVGVERYADLRREAALAARRLEGRTVWVYSSTSVGGGVAEMLHVLVGYIRDAQIDIRWQVITGDAEFFSVTKRIHNRLHGVPGDDGALGAHEAATYAAVTAANATSSARVREGDVVFLHDPQTAGMAAHLAEAGARVVWRCHIGSTGTNRWTDEAWSFLRPHLDACDAFVFSLAEYVPSWMVPSKVRVIPPSIDPFSPKNQEQSPSEVIRILGAIGLLPPDGDGSAARFTRNDGTPGRIVREASILADGPPPGADEPMVVQVSRWDRLKDMTGVLEGFARSVAGRADTHLALVGPSTGEVADDPEGVEAFAECEAAWRALPAATRRWIRLVTLPTDDIDENGAMVNALQRHATVVVQKSLREGFGLTVAEAMWKGRAVVASRVGGITGQISPGTGVLLDDPSDLDAFGQVLAGLLARPDEIARLGARAHQHVLEHFVGDRHLVRYAELVQWLVP
jgi:trehalose synthase